MYRTPAPPVPAITVVVCARCRRLRSECPRFVGGRRLCEVREQLARVGMTLEEAAEIARDFGATPRPVAPRPAA